MDLGGGFVGSSLPLRAGHVGPLIAQWVASPPSLWTDEDLILSKAKQEMRQSEAEDSLVVGSL